MTHARGILRLACLTAAFALAATAAQAQTEQSATQFYMAYRAAFAKATKVDELLPYMAKARRAEIEKTPAGERSKMFAFIKEFDTVTQIKVVKETKTATASPSRPRASTATRRSRPAPSTSLREDGGGSSGRRAGRRKAKTDSFQFSVSSSKGAHGEPAL